MTSRSRQICYVRHQKHVEIAYVLETPDKPGDAQEERKRKGGKLYTIYPKSQKPCTRGFPSAEERPKYLDKVLKEFDESENFTSLFRDTQLMFI